MSTNSVKIFLLTNLVRGVLVYVLPIHLHLASKLRMKGEITLPPYMPSWREQGKFYLYLNLLKPTGHVMHQQCNIQQLYVLSTLYLCVLYLSENKQLLVPLTA